MFPRRSGSEFKMSDSLSYLSLNLRPHFNCFRLFFSEPRPSRACFFDLKENRFPLQGVQPGPWGQTIKSSMLWYAPIGCTLKLNPKSAIRKEEPGWSYFLRLSTPNHPTSARSNSPSGREDELKYRSLLRYSTLARWMNEVPLLPVRFQ